jgi:hypothetical protein
MNGAVQFRTSRRLVRIEGPMCSACGDVVIGGELDERGHCSSCGPAQSACECCGALQLAECLTDLEGDHVCPACEEQRAEARAERSAGNACCNGSGCARCVEGIW